ncbi:heparinase II/III domain-containing protein [Vreelandella titanicae]|uniref:heparinase II/III domain-containing protein n=1 Tax=Vreelandella titanicae TaxID=664683 RepID=UPI003D05D30C
MQITGRLKQLMNIKSIDLDLGICERQAFGTGFSPTSNDLALANKLIQGCLVLSPHPEWQLPSQLKWNEDPFKQRNWRAQLHMLRWVDPLRRVGLDGNADAAAHWWKHVSDWLRKDFPPSNRFAWMDMVDGLRAKELVLGCPLVPLEHRAWYLQKLALHGEWLSSEGNRGHSNHALHQLVGLLLVGRLLDNEKWVCQAVSELGELFQAQYDEQGVNAEGATGYHLYNYRWWRNTFKSLDLEGLEFPALKERFESARLALVHATRPDGLLVNIGDTDSSPMLESDSPEMLYVKSKGAEGAAPGELFKVYDAGYIFGRSGWGAFERAYEDETFYSLMYGRGLKVHGHDDAGSITYYSQGRSWLVDPGKYAYVNDDLRDHLVSRAAHNVVILPNEQRSTESWVRPIRIRHDTESDEVVLEDEGYEGVKIQRRMVFHRATESLIVIDTVTADRIVKGVQGWQCATGLKAEPIKHGYRLRSSSGESLRVLWTGRLPERAVAEGQREPLRGWVSPKWMKVVPAPQLAATHTGKHFRFVTVLGPERKGEFDIERVQTIPGGIALTIAQGGTKHDLSLTRDGVVHEFLVDAPQETVKPSLHLNSLLPSKGPNLSPGVEPSDVVRLARQAVSNDGSAANRLAWGSALSQILITPQSLKQPNKDQISAALVDVLGEHVNEKIKYELTRLLPRRQPALVGVEGEVKGKGKPSSRYQIRNHKDAINRLAQSKGVTIGTKVENDLIIPWAARSGEGDILVVRLHGAINRQKFTLPVFRGLTAADESSQAMLVIQDPSLDLDASMNLSWYLGTKSVDGHALIANLVDEVRLALGVRRVIVTGSSGGGFAALHLSALLADSMAVAFNPQTDLRFYMQPLVRTAIKAVYGCDSLELVGPDVRTSVLNRWSKADIRPNARIYSNVGDVRHDRDNVLWLEKLVKEHNIADLMVSRYDGGAGHIAPSKIQMEAWLKDSIESFKA